ncbi:MAG: hypothetical protein CVU57_05725 [Deltaproteobacteria bacterium HGW-Deltaproteobacteria-15]|nr:MAG: hypothetical protein CVU57_05725 [Deltaproteobacteria bacterium HGW-Deltaproteobacteria-15]
MMPGLGEKFGIEVQVISKPREEYATEPYSRLGLPGAPAIMIGEEVLVEKADISEDKLDSAIRRQL